MRKLILGLMVGIAGTVGCTYDPDEEYFNNIQQPDPAITKISFFTVSDTADF